MAFSTHTSESLLPSPGLWLLCQFSIYGNGDLCFRYLAPEWGDLLSRVPIDLAASRFSIEPYVYMRDLGRFRKSLREALETESAWTCQFRLHADQAKHHVLRGQARPHQNNHGEIFWIGYFELVESSDQEIADAALNFLPLDAQVPQVGHGEITEMFHLLAENTSDGLAIMENGRLVYVSPAYLRILGYPESDELGRTEDDILALIHPDDRESLATEIHTAIANNTNQLTYTYRVRHINGSYIWREDSTRFVYENKSGIPKCYIVARDVTQRVKSEIALAESNQFLEKIGKTAKVGGWELDLSTHKLRWTSEVYRIYELEPEKTLQFQEVLTFYRPKSRQLLRDAVNRTLQTGEQWDLKLELDSAKKSHKWVRTICNSVMENEHLVRLYGSIHDITDEVHAHEALQEQEGAFHAALNAMMPGVAIFSEESVLYSNKSLSLILGYGPNESLYSLNVDNVVLPEDRNFLKTRHSRLKGGRGVMGPTLLRLIRKDRSLVPCMISTATIKWDGEHRIIASVTPMAENDMLAVQIRGTKERYEKLLVEDLERLQAKIANELHDSLGSKLSGVAMLLGSVEAPNKNLRHKLDVALRNLQEALSSTRALARGLVPVGGGPETTWSAIEHLCKTFSELSGANCRFELQSAIPDVSPSVGNNLYRIVQEALNNAVVHGRATLVIVTITSLLGAIELRISDNGIGLAKTTDLPNGMGMRSMLARANSIGAALSFRNNSDAGLSVLVSIT